MVPFIEVDANERPEVTNKGRGPSELALALEKGVTVFLPGQKQTGVGHSKGYLRRQGFRVVKRIGMYQGKPGLFVWAVKEA